jgi:hypothetical protein
MNKTNSTCNKNVNKESGKKREWTDTVCNPFTVGT